MCVNPLDVLGNLFGGNNQQAVVAPPAPPEAPTNAASAEAPILADQVSDRKRKRASAKTDRNGLKIDLAPGSSVDTEGSGLQIL